MIKHVVKHFVFLLLMLYSAALFSQSKLKLDTWVPLPPNAAEFARYGDIPVGNNLGIPDISFMLYELNARKVKIPITLSYHAGGIRVNQKSTDVGLGWSINTGGIITRTIFGTPDEKANGYFNYTPPLITDFNQNHNYYDMLLFTNQNGFYGKDLAPDLFNYSFPGKSGKFSTYEDKQFFTIPFEPIKISKQNTTNSVDFQIVDDDGNKYFYLDHATTTSDASSNHQYTNSWYLSYIVSADLVDTVRFTYETIAIQDQNVSESQTFGSSYYSINSNTQTSFSDVNYTDLLIKQISYKNTVISFNHNTYRKDINPSSNMMDEIIVKVNQSVVKKIVLDHGYFLAEPFTDNYANYRLKLTGFHEVDPLGNTSQQHWFGYNSLALPEHGSKSVDYWGFFNGKNNLTYIPYQQIYASDLSNTSFHIGGSYYNPSYTVANSFNVGGADRNVSESHMQASMLTKISYPTTGFVELEYEANRYLQDDKVKQTVHYGGITAGINKFTKSTSTYNFTTPNTLQSNITSLSANFSASNMGNTEMGQTQVVTLKNLSDNSTTTWTHTGDLLLSQQISQTFYLPPNTSYQLINEVYGNSSVTINSDISWQQETNQTLTLKGGGLRVKSIKKYISETTLVAEEQFTYGEEENGLAVKLFNDKNFYKNYEDFVDETYVAIGQCCGLSKSQWYRVYLGLPNHSSPNFSGSPLLYSMVTKRTTMNGLPNGKTVYRYDVKVDDTAIPDEFINSGSYGNINNSWNQANLKEITEYAYENSTYSPIDRKKYKYQNFLMPSGRGIQIKKFKTAHADDGCAYCDLLGPNPSSPYPGQGFFTYYDYPVKTGGSRLIEEVHTSYVPSSGDSVRVKKSYAYGNPQHLYITEKRDSLSNGNVLVSKSKYPVDFSDNINNNMVSKNVINREIENKLFKVEGNTEKLLNTLQTKYRIHNNGVVIDEVRSSILLNEPEVRLRYNFYDNQGNVLEQQYENGMKVSYLYSYNAQYPVAEIKNSELSAIVFILGGQAAVDAFSAQINPDVNTFLAPLRNGLPNAQITTYTYKPLVGITSMTDAKGMTTYYEYDAFQRLKTIKDQNGNILKQTDYHYKN